VNISYGISITTSTWYKSIVWTDSITTRPRLTDRHLVWRIQPLNQYRGGGCKHHFYGNVLLLYLLSLGSWLIKICPEALMSFLIKSAHVFLGEVASAFSIYNTDPYYSSLHPLASDSSWFKKFVDQKQQRERDGKREIESCCCIIYCYTTSWWVVKRVLARLERIAEIHFENGWQLWKSSNNVSLCMEFIYGVHGTQIAVA
jgi:hypothetical protein